MERFGIDGLEELIFSFFFFSFCGWVGETAMESLVRKHFVNKGVLKGPYVPVHGAGAFVVYAIGFYLKPYPALVFIGGTLACTVIEYAAALFLETVFCRRGWDYDTYPFTYWCNYKRRIALTTSLFFGLVTLCLVYFFWDFNLWIIESIEGNLLSFIDAILLFIFCADIILTLRRNISNKSAGIPNKTVGLE